MNKPEVVTNKHLNYLDALKESGITNMLNASPYLRKRFKLTLEESEEILEYWINSFRERHPDSF